MKCKVRSIKVIQLLKYGNLLLKYCSFYHSVVPLKLQYLFSIVVFLGTWDGLLYLLLTYICNKV